MIEVTLPPILRSYQIPIGVQQIDALAGMTDQTQRHCAA